jgi:hypothetical protein
VRPNPRYALRLGEGMLARVVDEFPVDLCPKTVDGIYHEGFLDAQVCRHSVGE